MMPRVLQGSITTRIAGILVLVGLGGLIWTFGPVLLEEVKYVFYHPAEDLSKEMDDSEKTGFVRPIVPVSRDFAVVVPKIGANAPIVPDVDPFDAARYQSALRNGVAHARGTSLPGDPGNAFFFAHSSNDLAGPGRYNTVFYLLNKLESGDRFHIAYQGRLYTYRVTDTIVVKPEDVRYLSSESDMSTATLMTCSPAGTTLRRLLVVGTLESSDDIDP